MNVCYLGLGSNLNTPERQLRQVLLLIAQHPDLSLIKQSNLYRTEPWGVRGQPAYCNMVVVIRTRCRPLELLKICQSLEKKMGRVRRKPWGARTMDIDILLFGNENVHSPRLTIPHPFMTKREFVMRPLKEVRIPSLALSREKPCLIPT